MPDRPGGKCPGNCIQTGPKYKYSSEMHIARIVDYAVLRICPKCPSLVCEILSLTHSCTAVVWHMPHVCVTV